MTANPKVLLKRALARFGFYLGRFPRTNTLDAHLLHLFSALRINCVFDVGAHHGDYGDQLRSIGYPGPIFSFEPVPENFKILSARCAADPKWRAFPFALGSRNETAKINVLSGATFSSFLSPSEYGRDQFGAKMRIERTQDVEVKRLADIFDECISGIAEPRVFLKMDTQGYDLAVVEGAGARLEQVLALQTELAVKRIYDSMATSFVEMIPAMEKRGFEVTGLFPVTFDPRDKLRVVEFDCVMSRAPQDGTGAASAARGPA
jgi:FkbM family methyltransferase